MGDLNERAGRALAGRWREGMLFLGDKGIRFRLAGTGPSLLWWPSPTADGWVYDEWGDNHVEPVPDVEGDPATRGAYLDVVREAWACPTLHLVVRWAPTRLPSDPGRPLGWKWEGLPDPLDTRKMTFAGMWPVSEAEALVAALEAAPR